MIAIVGSAAPSRVKTLGLSSVNLAADASAELGRSLARKGCHIVVYDSGVDYLEWDVVRGYAEIESVEPRSIQVRFSTKNEPPKFQEQVSHAELFSFQPDPNHEWERSFYHSLSEIDGILLIGGGSSTLRREPS